MTDQEKVNHLTFASSVSKEKLFDGTDWLFNDVLGPQFRGMLNRSFNSSGQKRMCLNTNACKVKGKTQATST